ncbi:MAG: hypothetical protein AAFO91_11330, partial [Bacteroidota bacterium]
AMVMIVADMRVWSGSTFAYAALSGLVAACLYAALWHYSKGHWIGLGDAKLAFPLGLLVSGGAGIFSLIVLSFWIGAVLSVGMLSVTALIHRGQQHLRFPQGGLTMKSEVPFAPFMVLAFLAVYCFGVDVVALTDHAISFIIY